jgi:hypothetical protein
MAKHKTPTKEELQEKIDQVIEEPVPDVIPEDEPEEVVEEKKIVVPQVPEVEEEPLPEPEPEAEPSEEVKAKLIKELEYKDHEISASARENQKIYAKNRVINKALAEAEDVQEPTEDELKTEFEDWDVMSTTERRLAKDSVVNKRWRETIKQAKDQATKIEKWNDSVESFVSDPKTLNEHPELEGKVEDFVSFATTDENNSVPFKILVSAFLHDQSTKVVKNKGKQLETGVGGSTERPIPKTNKITVEEGRKLRENDYAKWREYVSAGRIDTNVD